MRLHAMGLTMWSPSFDPPYRLGGKGSKPGRDE
jgi:hypothetical protein